MNCHMLRICLNAKWTQLPLAIAAAYLFSFVTGCNGGGSTTAPAPSVSQQAEHDHSHDGHSHDGHDHSGHDHAAEFKPATTFAEGVKQLESMRDTIRDAFGKKDPEAAHGPLHDVGTVLESLSGLADSAGLDAPQKEKVKTSVELLLGYFGKVDEAMHGKDGAKYEDVATKVDEAIKGLADMAAAKK